MLRIDPLLLLATLGLMAASIYTVGAATQDDIPGDPNYYVYRQAVFAAAWARPDAADLPLRLLAAARVEAGRLRPDDRRDPARVRCRRLGARRPGGRSSSASSTSRRRSSGSCCSSWRCRPSWSTACDVLHDRETTSRIMLLALVPAMLVVAQPDLGSGLVYLAIVLAVLFVAGTTWTPLRGAGGAWRGGRRGGARCRAGRRASSCSSRTRWTASRPSSTRRTTPARRATRSTSR